MNKEGISLSKVITTVRDSDSSIVVEIEMRNRALGEAD